MKLKKDPPDSEIPTSSMADIAFLLIIYFMVTTTFAATRGLDFALPKDDDSPPEIEKEDSVLINIQPGGQLMVDQKPMELTEILAYLKPKLTTNPKKPVIIQPEPNAKYGDMVRTYDVLRQGKIVNGNLQWLHQPEGGITQEELDDGKPINISIPTRREIEAFWFN